MTRALPLSLRAEANLELHATKILAGDPRPVLTLAAYERWLSTMSRFSPTPLSTDHIRYGLATLSGFTQQAFGGRRERVAYPLPTGMGKTEAAIAWVAALHQLSMLDDCPIAIVVSQVKELIRIRHLLVAAGVPREKIGLRHEKKFDPMRCDPENLPIDHASEPADPNALSRPIVLATHSRALGKKGGEIPQRDDRARNIVMWDESVIASCSMSVRIREIHELLNAISQFMDESSSLKKFLGNLSGQLKNEIDARNRGVAATELFVLSFHADDAKREVRRLRKQCASPSMRGVLDRVDQILDLVSSKIAVAGIAGDTCIITAKTILPDSLDSLAILDASYSIRELCTADPTIRAAWEPGTVVKRYDRVTVMQTRIGAGRETVEEDLQLGRKSRYRRYVLGIVESIPGDEGVLFITFRQRTGRALNFVEAIRRFLRAAGYDPDELLPDGRRRFSFLTWGNETSVSEYRYCRHVLFVGVLHRDEAELAASIAGQRRSLSSLPTADEVRAVRNSEVAHVIYQAMNRGSARITETGQAQKMHVYLPLRGDDIQAPLSKVMPGLQWKTLRASDILSERKSEMAKRVADYLSSVAPGTERIPTRKLKLDLPELGHLHRKQARIVIERGAVEVGWQAIGRSVVRCA